MEYLRTMDSETERNIRYWYFSDSNFDIDEVLSDLADGMYEGMTKEDVLEDALSEIAERFCDNNCYDWDTETIMGIYYYEPEWREEE